jgi:hypothetical protein
LCRSFLASTGRRGERSMPRTPRRSRPGTVVNQGQFAAQATSQRAAVTKNLVEAAGVELSRVVCEDERLLHAQQRTTRRVTTRSRQFRPVGQRLGSTRRRTNRGRPVATRP